MTPPSASQAAGAPTAGDLIVAIARTRDRGAFAALFTQYAPQVKRYLVSGGLDASQADELVQEVMLTVWRKADSYDPARASGTTWLYTIARNKRIDALRREKHPEIDDRDPCLVPATGPAADALIDAGRSRDAIAAALAELPAEQSRVLYGAYYEDKTLAALATEGDVPLGTVKSRVRLAMDRLRGVFAKKGEAP